MSNNGLVCAPTWDLLERLPVSLKALGRKRPNPERLALVYTQFLYAMRAERKSYVELTYQQWNQSFIPWLSGPQIKEAFEDLALLKMIRIETTGRGCRYFPVEPIALPDSAISASSQRHKRDLVEPMAGDTLLLDSSLDKEDISSAEANAPAPEPVDVLLSRMKDAIAKDRTTKIRLHYPSLEELEAQVDGYWASWNDFKTQTLPLENKSKEISAASAASQLALIFEMQNRYQLSAEAMRHGFTTAINKGVPNIMFVIKCARMYKP